MSTSVPPVCISRPLRWGRWLLAAAGVCASGCSASGALAKSADTASGGGDVEADGGAGLDTGPDLEPAWWSLSLQATVADGALQPDGSSLELAWLNQSGETICGGTSSLSSVRPASLDADGVFSWWELVAGDWSTDCAAGLRDSPVGTSSFYVGFGALHVELLARMGAETVDAGLSDNLNGAYLSRSTSGPVYAFGLAGPASAFDGLTAAQTTAPLAEGAWSVVPLFPLP